MNDVAGNFGANLKRVRTEKGVKRQEIAELLGVGVDLIGLYENGKRLAPLDKIFKIADYLKVSVVTLVGENGFSNEIPDIPKLVEDKIFEYRLQRALNLVNIAGISVEPYVNGLIISIPSTTKIITEDGTTEIIPLISAYRIKDNQSFVNIVELSESQAIKQDRLFIEVFQDKIHPTA